MVKADREDLVNAVRSMKSGAAEIWGKLVCLEPDDPALANAAAEVYSDLKDLLGKIISEPEPAAPGGRRCAFCNGQTEIPF
jgi:hypothetical protein